MFLLMTAASHRLKEGRLGAASETVVMEAAEAAVEDEEDEE